MVHLLKGLQRYAEYTAYTIYTRESLRTLKSERHLRTNVSLLVGKVFGRYRAMS